MFFHNKTKLIELKSQDLTSLKNNEAKGSSQPSEDQSRWFCAKSAKWRKQQSPIRQCSDQHFLWIHWHGLKSVAFDAGRRPPSLWDYHFRLYGCLAVPSKSSLVQIRLVAASLLQRYSHEFLLNWPHYHCFFNHCLEPSGCLDHHQKDTVTNFVSKLAAKFCHCRSESFDAGNIDLIACSGLHHCQSSSFDQYLVLGLSVRKKTENNSLVLFSFQIELFRVSLYFLLFGFVGEPFLELTPNLAEANANSRVKIFQDLHGVYHCSSPVTNYTSPMPIQPEMVRQEVQTLKSDFNARLKQVLFNAMVSTYYAW